MSVWYGMVWYGMVWYGMVWYGMVWHGMVWYGMVWFGMLGYSLRDTEDMKVQRITKIWILEGRYRVEINRVTAGMCVYM